MRLESYSLFMAFTLSLIMKVFFFLFGFQKLNLESCVIRFAMSFKKFSKVVKTSTINAVKDESWWTALIRPWAKWISSSIYFLSWLLFRYSVILFSRPQVFEKSQNLHSAHLYNSRNLNSYFSFSFSLASKFIHGKKFSCRFPLVCSPLLAFAQCFPFRWMMLSRKRAKTSLI